MKKLTLGCLSLLLVGCAAAPRVQQQPPLTLQLNGTAVEVQNFIEERMRGKGAIYTVENATDRALTIKANCSNLPNQKPLQCALIMMTIGNSGWDGPYLMMTFRTAEIRGVVNLSLQSEWCAINAFGKSNCTSAGSNNDHNEILDGIRAAYQAEVRN
jgi:hypothetical protein